MPRFAFVFAALLTSSALAATVDPPARVNMKKLDRTEIIGVISTYDESGFEVMDAKKQTTKIGWDEMSAGDVMTLHERLVRKGSADQWMTLAKKLLTMPGGRPAAERAFGKALRLDPKLKDQIAEIRKAANVPPARLATPQAATSAPTTAAASTQETTATEPPIDFDNIRDPQKPVVGPKQIGEVDKSAWGKQSPEQMATAIAELKAFGEKSRASVSQNLRPYETQYFLLYSDLSDSEAQKWVSVLDRMYAKLAGLFGVTGGENLWRGKALVFIFSKQEDYLTFEIKMHQTVAAGTAGMCHAYGNGHVHIAFYRQPNDLDFAHVLVHESVHGFLHRYRSPVDVPSWANEGLAEAIATDLVPRKGIAQSDLAEARQDLQKRKELDKFFDRDHIVAWQYPVARTLCEFMIQQNKPGYVAFINGIKDGMTWDESMKANYGVTVEQLVNAYGNMMGVRELKP